MDTKVKLFDYGKSYIRTFDNSDNNPRFLIESKCTVIDRGKTDEYYLGAPCKGEHTYSDKELFVRKAFELFPLFHKDATLVFRRFKHYVPTEKGEYKKTYGKKEIWGDREFIIKEIEGELLNTPEKIVKAVKDGVFLMGRIVIKKGIKVIIDFPIKTINTYENQWQVDTGPIVAPDFYKYPVDGISSFNLAFIAFNSLNLAEVMTESLVQFIQGCSAVFVARDDMVFKIENPEFYIYAV
jgi:hypothetical protein